MVTQNMLRTHEGLAGEKSIQMPNTDQITENAPNVCTLNKKIKKKQDKKNSFQFFFTLFFCIPWIFLYNNVRIQFWVSEKLTSVEKRVD